MSLGRAFGSGIRSGARAGLLASWAFGVFSTFSEAAAGNVGGAIVGLVVVGIIGSAIGALTGACIGAVLGPIFAVTNTVKHANVITALLLLSGWIVIVGSWLVGSVPGFGLELLKHVGVGVGVAGGLGLLGFDAGRNFEKRYDRSIPPEIRNELLALHDAGCRLPFHDYTWTQRGTYTHIPRAAEESLRVDHSLLLISEQEASTRIREEVQARDRLRIIHPNRFCYAGAPTGASSASLTDVAFTFAAFETGTPMIARLSAKVRLVTEGDPEYGELAPLVMPNDVDENHPLELVVARVDHAVILDGNAGGAGQAVDVLRDEWKQLAELGQVEVHDDLDSASYGTAGSRNPPLEPFA